MATSLNHILLRTQASVDQRKAHADLFELDRRAEAHTPRGFASSLRAVARVRPAVIAECKRASPSRGVIREVYSPEAIALEYERAGAAAISVLTEPEFFQGSLDHLSAVQASVRIPVLCKDFIVDEFQILEARAAGADAILLIVAALQDPQLRAFKDAAYLAQLDVLCEIHDREELARALDLGFQNIGVNCRNLKTFAVDRNVHDELAARLPDEILRVAESGISSPADIARLHGLGYNAFLVGEALMKQPSPGFALGELIGG
jgi:indole-3-glycerol phosphate synthase